ncbi:peptide deformylase [Bacillus xiapuensis]|uniref:peptide deformylase n=1 Tax=Bacillus xiapuensis TaxID=2014075 RepID=UPI000C230FB7|nr:peptide deformylase [Bacillus xiapuensis]
MAKLPIVHYPADILEKECARVRDFNKELKQLVKDMYETMIQADGVGLAAPQVGADLQVAVVETDPEVGFITLINPVIVESKGKQTDVEGCLSFPGVYGYVTRASYIKVKAQDIKGRYFLLEAQDFLARAIQHEIDHLHGILFTAKVEEYIEEEKLEKEGAE